jgi:hypothetical protein
MAAAFTDHQIIAGLNPASAMNMVRDSKMPAF